MVIFYYPDEKVLQKIKETYAGNLWQYSKFYKETTAILVWKRNSKFGSKWWENSILE